MICDRRLTDIMLISSIRLLQLFVEYKQPSNTRLACAEIALIKEDDRIGVTLRGGAYGPDLEKSRPLTIMNIRVGSPAYRYSCPINFDY